MVCRGGGGARKKSSAAAVAMRFLRAREYQGGTWTRGCVIRGRLAPDLGYTRGPNLSFRNPTGYLIGSPK